MYTRNVNKFCHFLGLKVGTMVKCTLTNDVVILDSLNVTALSQKDWEMLVGYIFLFVYLVFA